MSILKHIVTWKCPNKCNYCINQYAKTEVIEEYKDLDTAYGVLGCAYSHIAITGGEVTTLRKQQLQAILKRAQAMFKQGSLWTANPEVVSSSRYSWLEPYLSDVVLGIHEPQVESAVNLPYVEFGIPVYVSLLTHSYYHTLARHLLRRGYAGMTIREEFPCGDRLYEPVYSYANFPVVYREAHKCYGGTALIPKRSGWQYVECV